LANLVQQYQSLAGKTDARSLLISDIAAMSGETAKPEEVADALGRMFNMETNTDLKTEIVDELGDLETPAAMQPLLAALNPGQPPEIQEAVADAVDTLLTDLSFSEQPGMVQHIAKALDPKYPSVVRQAAVSALEDTDDKAAIPLLQPYLNDTDAEVRQAAKDAIEWLED
jgi:HEAT repeat protein